MNRLRVSILVAAVVALLGGGIWWLQFDWDRWKIERRMDKLVEALDKQPGEHTIAAASSVREAVAYFTDPMHVEAGPPVHLLSSREEMTALLFQVRNQSESMGVGIREQELEIDPDAVSATMRVTAEGYVDFMGEVRREVRRFRLDWIKDEGDWLIERVTLLEQL